MAVAAAVVSIASAAASYVGQRKQAKAQKRAYAAAEEERAQAELDQKVMRQMDLRIKSIERQRNIRRAVAEQRIQQATSLQAGYTDSGVSSSGYTAASAATTDQASAVGANNTGFGAAVQMSNLQTQYNTHVSNMQSILNKPIGSNTWLDMGGLLGSFGNEKTLTNIGGLFGYQG